MCKGQVQSPVPYRGAIHHLRALSVRQQIEFLIGREAAEEEERVRADGVCEGSVSPATGLDPSPVGGGGGSESDMLCPARTCERDRGGGGMARVATDIDKLLQSSVAELISVSSRPSGPSFKQKSTDSSHLHLRVPEPLTLRSPYMLRLSGAGFVYYAPGPETSV
ncbi:hypothetical protein J4Q44_G00370330 [Coregonus suidteri]|uniref:Uncharacterized protein n=1 Tax=Coregonus suidteri TaxID=861788 RepID=A0AAN8KCK9_9TELE